MSSALMPVFYALLGFVLCLIPALIFYVRKSGEVARLAAERAYLERTVADGKEAAEQLAQNFRAVSAQVLAESGESFLQLARENLGTFQTEAKGDLEAREKAIVQLLEPLKSQIGEFRKKVEDVYEKEGFERRELQAQVKLLADLNKTISEDAKNLTTALQGSNKIQGNYGELVLVDLLKKSGLLEGEHFRVQASERRDDGTLAQPDVVIHLPEGRRLVIDSKISLKAYVAAVNAVDETSRESAIKAHVASVKTHIMGLAGKNYHELYGLQSLDFVVMFVPIEPAFMMAIGHQQDLFADAWNRNVLLVSPSTLLFVVRTVAHLWRQEAQSKNAKAIADQGASLYNKLVGFVEDLDDLGQRLRQAQTAYEGAYKKLSTGRDSAMGQAQKLVNLGVKPKKPLPQQILERSAEELPLLDQAAGEEPAG